MARQVEIGSGTAAILDFMLEVADKSSDTVTYSETDIVSIALKMYQLAVTSEYGYLPAVEVFRTARQSRIDAKEADNGTA